MLRIAPGVRCPVSLRDTALHLRLTRDGLADSGLRGGEPRDRNAIRRAGDVVEADLVAERDGRGIAAMLAADADLQAVPRLAPALNPDLDELADTVAVQRDEWIDLQDALRDIGAQEARRVVAADAVGRLRQIVGAEGEEFRTLRD